MPFDDKIICQDCEKIFNELDRQFAEFIKNLKSANKNKRFPADNINPDIYRINFNVNYYWLDSFAASLLYRHSLSNTQRVSLGKYEVNAKNMVDKFNDKTSITDEQKTFSSICIINTARKLSKNAITNDITSYRLSGIKIYRFLVGDGIELHIKVSNQKSEILSNLRDDSTLLAMPLLDDFTKLAESTIYKSFALNRE